MTETKKNMFSKTAWDHATQPHHKGMLLTFNGHARVTGPCGDTMEFWLYAVKDRVEKVSFETDGCGSSLACGSMAACLAEGKRVFEAERIAEPANFLAGSARVPEILKALAQATILEAVAARPVDMILTTGKSEMERTILEGLVEKLSELNLKIQVVGVERQSAEPPSLVKEAFQNVVNAQEEMRTKIHEAENYRNQQIPKAKAEANNLLQEAEAYKVGRIDSAEGESERFLKLWQEYTRAPGVTRSRLLIEMVEQALPRTKIMALAKDRAGNPIRIKILQAPVPTTPRIPE